jgi:hypothetical protein
LEQIKYDEWIKLAAMPGHITVIIGRKGSGKSGQGYRIVEDIHKIANKDVYILGLPESAKKLLPKDYNVVADILEVPNGACVFTDEAALHFSSKDWYKKGHGELSKLIEIARHKELSLVFVTLNTASVDVNVLRFVDSVLFKPLSLLQLELERQQMKKIIAEAQKAFVDGVPEGEDERGYTYVIGAKARGMMKTELPSFWSDALSTSYEAFALRDENEEWEVPVLMGSKAGQGSEWACEDCVSWDEPDGDEPGWCTLGFFDVPRRKCDAQKRISKKPTRIKGKRNVKIKKNPQPAPLVDIEKITIARNEVGASESEFININLLDIAGPEPNPPEDPPRAKDFLAKMKDLCNSYLQNPKDIVDNLVVLQEEASFNEPIDYDPAYDRFTESLDRLVEFKSRERRFCGAIENPKYPFQKGDFVRLKRDQPLYVSTEYNTVVVHYRLMKEDTWPSSPVTITLGTVYQISGISKGKDGRDYFGLLTPNLQVGCWWEEEPILIDDLRYFEKVSAGERERTQIDWWQKNLSTVKSGEDWEIFYTSLNDLRETFHLNFCFQDTKGQALLDPEAQGDELVFFYPGAVKLKKYHVPLKELIKNVSIVDRGCERK